MMTNVLILVKSPLGPPYPYLKDRGMRRPILKACMRRAFHNARMRVTKIVLVAIAWSGGWRCRGTTTGAASSRALSLLALLQFGFILHLLNCLPLFRASFQHRFRLRKSHQAILPPRDLFAHHQPIWHLWLFSLFAEGKQLLNLCSQLGLQLQQTLVADRFASGGHRHALLFHPG